MTHKRLLATLISLVAVLLCASQAASQEPGPLSTQATYGSAFTYQGQLKDAGGPINGVCDLRFKLWDAASGGAQAGNTLTLPAAELEDGLFTARLDFGMDVHRGAARWLEVAVRCPAGSSAYVSLSPRQELTGAPAALSLALPFTAEANIGGPLVSFQNSGDGEAALFSSQGSALWVESAGLDGLHVASAGGDGVHVNFTGGHGVYVDSAGLSGVYVNSVGSDGVNVVAAGSPSMMALDPKANGFEVGGAQGDGLAVGRADHMGVRVGSAGGDGVYVGSAGSPSNLVISPENNGFEVAGAEGHGLYVGRADRYGVAVDSAGWYGMAVGSANVHGVYVDSAGFHGVVVASAGEVGVLVGSAGHDGVFVHLAGNPSASPFSTAPNGFEVAGAEGHGLYVGRADDTGVFVHSAGWNGVVVEEAGGDGVRATATAYNALYGDTANAQGEWGLYTPDKVHAQNVTLQTLTLVAQVTGPDALSPGDVVAAAGVAPPSSDNGAPLPLVRLAAADWNGVVGVVEGRLAFTSVPQPEGEEKEQRLELRSAEGPAQPGDYAALTVLGLAQVKVDAGQGLIQPGTRLTSSTGGRARALKTVVVEGLTLAESAPTIGIALAAPDEDGLVWVLVNPQ